MCGFIQMYFIKSLHGEVWTPPEHSLEVLVPSAALPKRQGKNEYSKHRLAENRL